MGAVHNGSHGDTDNRQTWHFHHLHNVSIIEKNKRSGKCDDPTGIYL